jgi:hypothetical protein
MRARLWAIGFLMCGLGLLSAAAWQYFSPEDGPGLVVDEPEREISGCSVGQTSALTFAFHNRARHPVQIIGLAPC